MAHAANGALFNLDSSREVSEALFDRMRLPVPPESKETKSKSGYWSTGKEVGVLFFLVFLFLSLY